MCNHHEASERSTHRTKEESKCSCDENIMLFDCQPVNENTKSTAIPHLLNRGGRSEVQALTTALLCFSPLKRANEEPCNASNYRPILSARANPKKGTPKKGGAKPAGRDSQDSLRQPWLEIPSKTKTSLTKALGPSTTTRPSSMSAIMHRQLRQRGEERGHHSEGRPRSRAISIPRPPSNKVDEEKKELESAMNEYDWATWRMYNRLIEHRQRRNSSDTAFVEGAGPEGDGELLHHDSQHQDENLHAPLGQIHDDEYGGIFELEL